MDSQTTRAESELEKQRQRLLEQLLAEEGLEAPSAAAIVPRDPSAPVPLTFAQEVLWLLDRATPGLTAYNTPLAKRIRGELDIVALERALAGVVARNEALRTVFRANGDGAEQVVLDEWAMSLSIHDVSALPFADREGTAVSVLRTVANTPFDLTKEPGFRAALARISDDDHILLLLTHHIVSDAWSYGLIFRELGELYDAERAGTTPDLPAVGLHYGDYAAWQRETLRGDALDTGLSYWRERLANLPVLELPTEHARPMAQGFAGARRSAVVPRKVYLGLRELAQRTGTTTYMMLLSAYATVLRQYTSQDDIIVGSAVAGRTNREMEGMVGYFSQALPMRVRFDGDPTVKELLGRVAETVLAAFEHQDTPLEPLMSELQSGRALSHAPLFRVVLTMQDTMGADLRLGDAEISAVELDAAGTKFDLTLLVTERADDIDLTLWYRTDLFTGGYAERFLGHMRSVLEAMVADPAQRASELSVLTPAEREKLETWNATSIPEGAAATVTEIFERQAARVPERVAVVAPEGVALSYGELNAGANKLARYLQSLGVGEGDPVGLNLDRSAPALIGLLGVLKAGGCYVPLPPDVPQARRMQQLRESGAKVLLTLAANAAETTSDVTVVALDRDAAMLDSYSTDNPKVSARPSSLAYVLFTSGSTGVPKGVAVTHANAVHYARAVSRVLGDVPADTVGDGFAKLDGWEFALASTLGADLGNTSLLPSLLAGGTLHVLSKDVTTEPSRYADYLAKHPIDVLKITPNHFMALVAGKQGGELSALVPRKWIVFGGETLRPDVGRALLGANRCRVLNHYGPTETTVGVLTFEVTSKSLDAATALGAQSVPLGRPLTTTHVYVVDATGRELPVGVPGELLIGGAGVAQGYLKRADLTAEKFTVRDGERVYHTGDRIRRLADGTVEFLGRGDDQVKVRGYRVELGEIEAAMRAHPGLDNGVVAMRDAQLVAYAVPKPGGYAVSHSDRPTSEKITEWLGAQLPEYMVPSVVMLVETLPLTANGKIDRARLPEPSSGEPEKPSFVAPRTPTETQLATIWAEVLKRDTVGVTDNFLALGGHSLLAIRLLGKISKAFGVRLPLRSLFESPTVEQIAAAVDKAVAEK